jgi:hypothetical protein
MKRRLPNIYPGEVLLEEFLRPFGISQNRLAREIRSYSYAQLRSSPRGKRRGRLPSGEA